MKPPKHLGDVAQKEWNRVVPRLVEAGRFDDSDQVAMEVYCAAYERFVDALEKVNRAGSLINTDNGVKVSPAYDVMERSARILDKYIQHFGFSPSSRKRMELGNLAKGQEDDPLNADWDALAERHLSRTRQ